MLVGSTAHSDGSSVLLCLLALRLPCLQLTTNLITKAEQGVNGLIAKLGAPAVLSQHSPHASVQQLLHATKSLGELNAGSALNSFHVGFQCFPECWVLVPVHAVLFHARELALLIVEQACMPKLRNHPIVHLYKWYVHTRTHCSAAFTLQEPLLAL